MSRSPADVLAEILADLPSGWALDHREDGYTAAWLQPLASEISLVEAAMEELTVEVDPRAATYLLPDYQRVLGPDPAGRDALAVTWADQATLAFQRWTAGGDVCAGYFIAQAAAMGETITITENVQSLCGRAVCGSELVPVGQNFAFLVSLPSQRGSYAICGEASCGNSSLGSITPDLAAALISYEAPLHTRPVFSYV